MPFFGMSKLGSKYSEDKAPAEDWKEGSKYSEDKAPAEDWKEGPKYSEDKAPAEDWNEGSRYSEDKAPAEDWNEGPKYSEDKAPAEDWKEGGGTWHSADECCEEKNIKACISGAIGTKNSALVVVGVKMGHINASLAALKTEGSAAMHRPLTQPKR